MYFRIELLIGSIDYVTIVYSIEIYQELLVEFSCDLYKTLINTQFSLLTLFKVFEL